MRGWREPCLICAGTGLEQGTLPSTTPAGETAVQWLWRLLLVLAAKGYKNMDFQPLPPARPHVAPRHAERARTCRHVSPALEATRYMCLYLYRGTRRTAPPRSAQAGAHPLRNGASGRASGQINAKIYEARAGIIFPLRECPEALRKPLYCVPSMGKIDI